MKRLLVLLALVLGLAEADDRRSGFDDMAPETQALQRDDTLNPAWLWVRDGERLWSEPAGAAGASCARCHGAAAQSMRGVAARHPAFDATLGQPLNLAGRINACRQRQQHAPPWAPESDELLALEAYVALASRGMPIVPPQDTRLDPWRERGRQLYQQRQGQLDLSCAMCHDRHPRARLGGSAITQGQATGYPLYRLEWQGMGSLQRRLRNCLNGVRAVVPPLGSAELLALELHLAQRAAGLPFEAPAVRP